MEILTRIKKIGNGKWYSNYDLDYCGNERKCVVFHVYCAKQTNKSWNLNLLNR